MSYQGAACIHALTPCHGIWRRAHALPDLYHISKVVFNRAI